MSGQLQWAIEKRDQLICDLLERQCRRSCADCEHEKDEGCEFMARALELGIDVYGGEDAHAERLHGEGEAE